ncbi:2-C-methyl-D-erythritol 4-phosphate cytidylyltransferase [bacterium]|nr:2-C-methyl-D-erythritol 4-phosphate cytidylyltransferase [bacterium]
MKSKAVIIPAAGSGTRLGSDVPKAFIEVSGKTILQRSIECFLNIDGMMQIIIPAPKNYISTCKRICSELESRSVSLEVVEGGSERQYSIWNGIKVLNTGVELVAVHDAARPFVKEELIVNCFKTADEFGGAVLGVPVKDTIKEVKGYLEIKSTPERDSLWQAQTPQVFTKDLIVEAYRSALKEDFLGTDDASLVERIDGRVKMVMGDFENLKITYPVDLKMAEIIAEGWNA